MSRIIAELFICVKCIITQILPVEKPVESLWVLWTKNFEFALALSAAIVQNPFSLIPRWNGEATLLQTERFRKGNVAETRCLVHREI